nr:hypothetical transcript [Hymenolepis microstoma]CDS34985.2 hypothetical transcript [Hymenolepis microstoma]
MYIMWDQYAATCWPEDLGPREINKEPSLTSGLIQFRRYLGAKLTPPVEQNFFKLSPAQWFNFTNDCSYAFLECVGGGGGDEEEKFVPRLDLRTMHNKLRKGKYQNKYELAADMNLLFERYHLKDKNVGKLLGIFREEYKKCFGDDYSGVFASSDLKFYLFERILALPCDRLEKATKILRENVNLAIFDEFDIEMDKLELPVLYKLKAYIDSIPDREFFNERYFVHQGDRSKNQSLIMCRSERRGLSDKIDQLSDENKRNVYRLIRRYEPFPVDIKKEKLSYHLADVRFSHLWKIKGYVELLYEQEEKRLISADEMASLCDKILHMNPEKRKVVCDRIIELDPTLPKDINEIFFRFHTFKNDTLRAIERFVNSMD